MSKFTATAVKIFLHNSLHAYIYLLLKDKAAQCFLKDIQGTKNLCPS